MPDQSKNNVLAIDVGNSRVKIGLFLYRSESDVDRFDIHQLECLEHLAVDVSERVDWSVIESWGQHHTHAETAIIAGSNPERMQSLLESMPDSLPKPIQIDHYTKIPVDVRVDFPERVGIDRLLNALAVHHFKASETNAIVVSSGTATTVDVVSKTGVFEGGTILPGFELCARALHQYTSLLPLLELDSLQTDPPVAIGKNTEAAMLSGLFWGEVGAIEKVIQLQMQELGDSTELFLTGGAAPLIAPHLTSAHQHIPNLALLGLASIAVMEGGHP